MIVILTVHTSHSLFSGGLADQTLAFLGHECSLSVPSNTLSPHAIDTPSRTHIHRNTANLLMNTQLVS